MTTTSLRVGIIGGGIGGLALAQGLTRSGIDVAVFERDRARDARLEGYRIHVNPAGSRSLHSLLPAESWTEFLATTGRPDGGFTLLDRHLRTLVRVEDHVMYPDLSNPVEGHYPVDRTVLRQLLLDGIEDVVQFGRSFTSFDKLVDGKVAAHFSDGSVERFDVLVGADGSSSAVREQLLPGARRVDTGAVAVGLRLPLDEHSRTWIPPTFQTGMNLVMAPQPSFLFTAAFDRKSVDQLCKYTFDPEQAYRDYVLCAFVVRTDSAPAGLARLSQEELKEFVGNAMTSWHPEIKKMIDDSDERSAATFAMKASAPVEGWKTGRVTVLGDALHSMPPVGGLGANAALRDARLLRDMLDDVQGGRRPLLDGLAYYEQQSRRHGFAAVNSALTTQRQGLTRNPAALAASNAWFGLTNRSQLLRKLTFSTAWNASARPLDWERDLATGRSL